MLFAARGTRSMPRGLRLQTCAGVELHERLAILRDSLALCCRIGVLKRFRVNHWPAIFRISARLCAVAIGAIALCLSAPSRVDQTALASDTAIEPSTETPIRAAGPNAQQGTVGAKQGSDLPPIPIAPKPAVLGQGDPPSGGLPIAYDAGGDVDQYLWDVY